MGGERHPEGLPLSVDPTEAGRKLNGQLAHEERCNLHGALLSETQKEILFETLKAHPMLTANQIGEMFEIRTGRVIGVLTVRKYRRMLTKTDLQKVLKKKIAENAKVLEVELQAIEEIDRALLVLSDDSIERVLKFVADRFGMLVDCS